MPDEFTSQALTELVRPFLDVSPGSWLFSPMKTGKHNRSFWVEGQSGRYVLRIAPPDDAGFLYYERLMRRQEPSLHNF